MPEGTRELRLVVTASNYDNALYFYRDVLGLAEQAAFADDNGGRASLLHAGRATIELADDAHAEAIDGLEVGHRVAGPIRLAFEVGDAAAVTDRLVAAGARLVAPPVRTPWGSLNARLDGPDGHQLTVYSPDVYVTERTRLDGQVVLAEPDPTWATTSTELTRDIRGALGSTALVVEHVGSTSVPGLPAKPVIDLVLGVPDPVDETAYVASLEALGYVLHIREPEWHEHRLLKRVDPAVNLHVFAAGADEIDRMLAFRDHLRRDSADRDLYLRTKRVLASRTWTYVQDYADAKSEVVGDIMARAMAFEPGPLRGCFVLVSGPDDADLRAVAADLGSRLGLPVLAAGTVREAMGKALGPADDPKPRDSATNAILLALAAQSGGAVLSAPRHQDQSADVAALPGQVIEVSCGTGEVSESAATRWPVLGQDMSAPVDVEALARRIRQVVGSAG